MKKTHSERSAKPVDRQIVLPMKTALSMSFRNLRIRFMRSLVTTVSLVLAVAFLSFILLRSNIAQGYLSAHGPSVLDELTRAGFSVASDAQSISPSPRERWIVFLSLLVCAVGIINAQLMSVTERFREIGVMKCLGALDRFVLRIFLLEAGMLGATGSACGVLLGLLVSLGYSLVTFGSAASFGLLHPDALLSLLFAFATGIFLTLAGVLYPAYLAARMRPIAALGSEH